MSFRNKNLLKIILVVSALFAFSSAFALPEGAKVVKGSATIDTSVPNTLNIVASTPKVVIEYSSFNVAQNETVNFQQLSSTSMALNRVIGLEPSLILGTINANGIIFLVNPNGITFGQTANIQAAGLVATTMNITNQEFLAANASYAFSKVGAKNGYVINQGQIIIKNGGYVCLLSQAVENQGVIEAELGKVVLASGEKVTVNLDDLGEISVVIDEAVKDIVFGPDGQRMDSAVKNSGKIIANGGKVILTAKVLNNIFDYAVNNTGIIQANNLVEHEGIVELVAEGAPVINIGKIEAGKVNIQAKNTDFINQGLIIAESAVPTLDAPCIDIKALNILQGGLISAAGIVDITAEAINEVAITSEAKEVGAADIDLDKVLIQGSTVNINIKNNVGTNELPLNLEGDNIYR
jgi:filamentous hemagglutinin family protein